MTSAPGNASPAGDMLTRLKGASSAEDFFALLQVDYDAKVINVARLHILKRMSEYLTTEDFVDLPDSVVTARCTAALHRAYDDFVTSSPLQQRVFKVLKNAVAIREPTNFVPFDSLLK